MLHNNNMHNYLAFRTGRAIRVAVKRKIMWNVAAEWLGHVGDTVRIKTDAHFTSIFRSIYTSLCIGINTLVMRLALYLCSKKGPPGNIWRG